MLCREVLARVLELERPPKPWAVVVIGEPTERKQRLGIGGGPAPAIEADNAPEVGNHFALDQLTVEGRPAELQEPLSAASPLPLA